MTVKQVDLTAIKDYHSMWERRAKIWSVCKDLHRSQSQTSVLTNTLNWSHLHLHVLRAGETISDGRCSFSYCRV